MGLVFDQVQFDGRAPELTRIADKVTELCGLPVIVQHSGADEKMELHDQHGRIAFACAAQDQLEICSYHAGAVRKFHDELTDGVALPTEKYVQGLNEPAGTQAIHLRGFIGLETLMGVTLLALEALGGRPRAPISDEMRREYGKPITEADLLERRRQLQKQLRKIGIVQTLLLPVTLPLFVLRLSVHLAAMPWILWKAWRSTKAALSKRDHEKLLSSFSDDLEFATANLADYDALDRQTLQHYTQALESLGFVHAADYFVRSPKRQKTSKRPPGFARLWVHPAYRCFAEVNQTFSQTKPPTAMRCALASWLEDGWDLSTTDRELASLNFAWRRPRNLWSWHPRMSPAELLAEHLRRRQRMMDALGIVVVSELTPDAYFAHARKSSADRKEALRTKSIETIRAERKRYEQSPIPEWSGDLPANCWGR